MSAVACKTISCLIQSRSGWLHNDYIFSCLFEINTIYGQYNILIWSDCHYWKCYHPMKVCLEVAVDVVEHFFVPKMISVPTCV